MLSRYRVSEIYPLFLKDKERFNKHFRGPMEIVFDDGEVIKTTGRATLCSLYTWQLMDRYSIGFYKRHHLKSQMSDDGYITNAVVGKIIESLIIEIRNTYRAQWVEEGVQNRIYLNPNENIRAELDRLNRRAMEVSTEVYNVFAIVSLPYMSSVSLEEIVEIAEDPKALDSAEKMVASESSLRNHDAVIRELVLNDPAYRHNRLRRFAKTKVVKLLQLLQMISTRGYLTDIGSGIFDKPIMTNYLDGMTDAYNFAIDSRSAAKALAFAEQPLEDGSYAHRKERIASGYSQNVHMGDCGSTRYLPWNVTETNAYAIIGMYHFDTITGETLAIDKFNVKKLIGKQVLLRHILGGCNHEDDAQGVCSTCFGEQALALHYYTIAGVNVVSRQFRDLIQGMLATKHFDGIASLKPVILRPTALRNITVEDNRFFYFNRKELTQFNGVYVTIRTDNISALDNLAAIDLNNYSAQRLDELSTLSKGIKVVKRSSDGEEIIEHVTMTYNGKCANLSKEFLAYIKAVGYDRTQRNEIVINMSRWDWTASFAALPRQHFTLSAFQQQFSDHLESPRDRQGSGVVCDPIVLLKELHNIINELGDDRFKITLPTLSMMILPLCARDPDAGDYRLPKAGEGVVMSLKDSMTLQRSASALITFQQMSGPIRTIDGIWNGKASNPKHPPLIHALDSLIAA